MIRLAHSRAATFTLVVILQLAFLPLQESLRCLFGAPEAHSTCCCAVDLAPLTPVELPPADTDSEHCGHEMPPTEPVAPKPVPLPGGEEETPCGCYSEAEDPRPLIPLGRTGTDEDSKHLAPNKSQPGLRQVTLPATARSAIPRARTGPPLFVLYQVFLI